MAMLKERDTVLCKADPSRKPSHFFNSFFMERLLITNKGYCYKEIKRWSKTFDLFTLDKVYFPVNIFNTHWTMVVLYMQRKEIRYYDSMNGKGTRYLEGVKQWIVDEAREKKNNPNYDVSGFRLIDQDPQVPQQMNGVDCGVFATVSADFISDNLELSYDQRNMPYFRRKIAADILRGSLTYATQ